MMIQESPDVTYEQRMASELIKRIRKLRWMGMDEEAHRMVRSGLRLCASEPALGERSERGNAGSRLRME